MNYSNLIADALQYGATASGYNMTKAREWVKTFSPDRRYQLYAVCGTASWNYNENGKVLYAGREYEYQQTKTGYIVHPTTW
jgi:hypothetical protein